MPLTTKKQAAAAAARKVYFQGGKARFKRRRRLRTPRKLSELRLGRIYAVAGPKVVHIKTRQAGD